MRQRLNGNAHWMVVLCVVVCLCMGAFGCDDTSSDAAKLEDARIAIDNGQYDRALDILSAMGGKEVLEVRASANAGKAGINTFDILGELDDASDTNGFDIVGKMLGTGETNTLTLAQIKAKSGSMDLAKQNLLDSVGGHAERLDDDGKTQLAIFALTDTVLIVGDILFKTPDYNLQGEGAKITLTKEWLDANVKAIDSTYSHINPTPYLPQLDKNIKHIGDAIPVLKGDNDLAEEFTEFQNEIGGQDNAITAGELKTYLAEKL